MENLPFRCCQRTLAADGTSSRRGSLEGHEWGYAVLGTNPTGFTVAVGRVADRCPGRNETCQGPRAEHPHAYDRHSVALSAWAAPTT